MFVLKLVTKFRNLSFELNKLNLQPEFSKATLQLLLFQHEFQGKIFIYNQSQMKIKKDLYTYLNLEPKKLHIINNFIKHCRFVSLQPQFS